MHLTTYRLLLREFGEGDWPAVLAYQRDQRYLRFYPWAQRRDEEVRAFVQAFIAQQQEQPRTKFQLAVCLQANGLLIGNCGIRMQHAGATEADIGYELAPGHWGRGYATEAAHAIVAFGFNELKLHRLWAHCIADNVASTNVLEKLGMRLEGRQRENQWFKERWWDTLLFGVLEHEWKGRER
jgi:ribosomal-protein-alanine N-acetyltransferase